MHRLLALATFAMAATPLLASSEFADPARHDTGRVLEFRGVELGASEAKFTSALPYFRCRDSRGGQRVDRTCDADLSSADNAIYAGVAVDAIEAAFYADRLCSVRLTFKYQGHMPGRTDDPWLRLTDALESRFGKPTRMGVSGAVAIWFWKKPRSELTATRRDGPEYVSVDVLYGLDDEEQDESRRKQPTGTADQRGM